MKHKKGTRGWALGETRWGYKGVMDHVLSMLEQELITRRKAEELIRELTQPGGPSVKYMDAPWRKIKWAPHTDETQ